jgi:hypothetical protein
MEDESFTGYYLVSFLNAVVLAFKRICNTEKEIKIIANNDTKKGEKKMK